MQAIVNYCLNRFCPLIVIGLIVFAHFGLVTWQPWLVMAMVLFVEKFHFNTGYAVAFCEERGLPLE